VLGGLLIDASALPSVQSVLNPAAFYVERNGLVFGAICAVSASGATPDLLTVQAELERSSSLDAVGGIAYLAGLDASLPDLSQLPRYAREVADLAQQREVMRLAAAVASGRGGALDELMGVATAIRGRQ